MTAAASDRRKRELGLIHIGKTALGLDDGDYRDLLERVGGKRSSADLSDRGRHLVIEEMKRLGFKPARKGKAKRPARRWPTTPMRPQAALVCALWDELAEIGAFRYGHNARLDTWMKKKMKVPVSHPNFATPAQLSKMIEALKDWLDRVKAKRGAEKSA